MAVSRRDVIAMVAIVSCAMVAITITAVVVTSRRPTAATVVPTKEALLPTLDDVLLDPGAVRGVLGGGDLRLNSADNLLLPPLGAQLAVTPPECLAVATLGDGTAYSDVKWLSARRSVIVPITDVPGAPVTVMQSVVIMPSPAVASSFVDQSLASWRRCQGQTYHFGPDATARFVASAVDEVDGTVVARSVQVDVPSYLCVHALAAHSRYVVEVRTCGTPVDKAAKLITKLTAKLPS